MIKDKVKLAYILKNDYIVFFIFFLYCLFVLIFIVGIIQGGIFHTKILLRILSKIQIVFFIITLTTMLGILIRIFKINNIFRNGIRIIAQVEKKVISKYKCIFEYSYVFKNKSYYSYVNTRLSQAFLINKSIINIIIDKKNPQKSLCYDIYVTKARKKVKIKDLIKN